MMYHFLIDYSREEATMPVYAPTPAFAATRRHPRALLLIIAAHAALIGAVMSARMDLPQRIVDVTRVTLIPEPLPPPPEPERQPPAKPQPQARIDQVPPLVPLPQPNRATLDPTPLPIPSLDPPRFVQLPLPDPRPLADPVRVGPRFATPASALRPPYPDDKRRLGEETMLRLRLSIDARGRVVAVDPVGAADPVFLAAARRHLLARWRYQPATEDGRAIASTTVITLRFELEE